MDKSDLCQQLFDDIKDNIEYDSDINALVSLLLKMLKYNVTISFTNWKYLILKYDIENLSIDMDFLPIIKTYPEKLFKEVGIERFFIYMQEISHNKQKYLYKSLFNVYDSESLIYQVLSNYIKKNNDKKEKKLIKVVLSKSKQFSKATFDKTELIKQAILLHIKHKNVPLDFLKELISSIESIKEQAVLKTLLIDYFIN